jgi:FkbM family methyltransferase
MRTYPLDNLPELFLRRRHFDDDAVVEYCREILKPGMTVIDLGANYGQFSLLALRHISPAGRLFAFEPGTYAFQRLQENVDRQARQRSGVTLTKSAVWCESGLVELYEYPPEYSFWNSLRPHKMWSDTDSRADERGAIEPTITETVRAVTLDDFCTEMAIDWIDLLKIDVEGLEVEVLQGATGLIRAGRIGRVIFEISLDPLAGTGRTGEDVLQAVSSMGMDISRILPDGSLEEVRLPGFQVPFFANYLAVPRVSREPLDRTSEHPGRAGHVSSAEACQR